MTTKKKTAAATVAKVISAFRNAPYLNVLPLIVKVSVAKSCLPKIAAMSGVRRSLTNDAMTAPKRCR